MYCLWYRVTHLVVNYLLLIAICLLGIHQSIMEISESYRDDNMTNIVNWLNILRHPFFHVFFMVSEKAGWPIILSSYPSMPTAKQRPRPPQRPCGMGPHRLVVHGN